MGQLKSRLLILLNIAWHRPEGSAWDRVAGYFMGGPLELDDFGYAGRVATHVGGSTNRYGFRTVTSGNLRLRGSVMLQGTPLVITSQGLKPSVAVGGFKPTARSRIDEIYEQLREVNQLQQKGNVRSTELLVSECDERHSAKSAQISRGFMILVRHR